MKKQIIFIVLVALSCVELIAQNNIQGTVTDETGELLPGVSVVIQNSSTGTSTNIDGKYLLKNVKDSDVLVFRYLGYEVKTVKIQGKKVINVELKPSSQKLDEIVVVGYGSTTKKELTNAVATVKVKDLENTATANFDQALAGRVSGVQVTSTDGTPGENLKIIIRGGNSITGDNSPLYVVDGIPLEDFDPGSISTDDIKSFNILKDAGATAIYGSRGANGIIIIETKGGRKDGKTRVNLKASHSAQFIPRTLEVLSPYQYVKYRERVALALDEYQTGGQNTLLFYNSYVDPELYRDAKGTNWQEEIFRLSSMSKYNVSVSGGGENTSIYNSFEYLDQEGTLVNTGFRKIINNLKITHKISDKTKFFGQIQFSETNRLGLRVAENRFVSIIRDALRARPVEPINGDNLFLNVNEPELRQFFDPVRNLENTDREQRTRTIRGNAKIFHKFSDNLMLKSNINYQISDTKQSIFYERDTQQGTNSSRGINGGIDFRALQILSTSNTLQYDKKVGKGRVKTLLGFEMQERVSEFSSLRNSNLLTDIFGIDKLGIGTNPSVPQTSFSKNRLLSYFGRFQYDYKYKYYFKFIFRADGSSKFSKNNRWGYFPAISTAWRFEKEDFIKDLDFISSGKLRVDWGLTGNNRIGNFDSQTQLDISTNSGYIWGDNQSFQTGSFVSNLGVPDLKWETTSQLNFGLDFGFLNNRFTGTIDYYIKQTRDLLLNADVPADTGFLRIQQNIGKVENKGFELSLTSKNINKENFKWSTTLNFSFNRNKTLALNNGQNEILSDPQWHNEGTEFQYITRVGQPVGMMYGLIFDGVYQDADFIFDNASQTSILRDGIPDNGGVVAPGSSKYVDQNNDGTINDLDRVIIGKPQATNFGGLTNNFEFGNFDAQIHLQWAYDFDVLNANKAYLAAPTGSTLNAFPDVLNVWTPTNTDTNVNSVKYESIFGRPVKGNRVDNRFIEDGSFLRLNTVSLGYNFPKRISNALKMDKLRLFVQGQNLYTWTNYTGYNPDVSVGRLGALAPNLDAAAYPQSVTILGGVNISF